MNIWRLFARTPEKRTVKLSVMYLIIHTKVNLNSLRHSLASKHICYFEHIYLGVLLPVPFVKDSLQFPSPDTIHCPQVWLTNGNVGKAPNQPKVIHLFVDDHWNSSCHSNDDNHH